MKKICLLTITSFCTALAFSQSAVQTVPGQPKPGRAVVAKTTTSTPVVSTSRGTQRATSATTITTKGSVAVKPTTVGIDAYQNATSLPQAQKAADATKAATIKATTTVKH